jgi:NADPH-dependent glutamate synthase beta subunit-like oxidoreductase
MSHELVDFVPLTRLGKDLHFKDIYEIDWSCIYFANGAWKDRSFPFTEIENFSNFYYQNPFVYWFNHYHESSYKGISVDVKDNALVVGGGLASIDVCKIIQLELVKQKVESKIEGFDIVTMEHKGISKYLEMHDIDYDSLDINGATLVYRRDVENMPLTTIPDNSDSDMVAKRKLARRKVLKNMQDKFLFKVAECTQPTGLHIVDNNLEGLKIIKNEIVDGKPVAIKGSEDILKGSIIISSIGSLPEPIEGVPMDGSTYNIVDQESGKFDDLDKVHGMGNAVTGKGNIKASRVSAKTVGDLTIDLLQDVSSDTVKIINNKVKEWQEKVSYDGNYFEWKAKK